MPKSATVNKKFLENEVRKAIKGKQLQVVNEDLLTEGFWSRLGDNIGNSFQNFKRWAVKKLYHDDREQAVAQIDSDDEDVSFIKDYFSLFGDICYEGSNYSEIYRESLTIEDPGTYCLYESLESDLNEWFSDNRSKFISKFSKIQNNSQKLRLIKSYAEDFLETFDFFGFQIELGGKKLVIEDKAALELCKLALLNENFNSDFNSQIQGKKPCVLDMFVLFFRFVNNLNVRAFKSIDSNKIYRAAYKVATRGGAPAFLKGQKRGLFVKTLRRNPKLKKKWSGFCFNITYDPYGEFDLNHWTGKAAAFHTKSLKTQAEVYADMTASVGGMVAVDTMAIKAAMASYASYTGAAVTTGPGALIVIAVIGVSMFLHWDPFEFFSIRDDVEDELVEMKKIILKLLNLSPEQSSGDSEGENEEIIAQLKQLEEEYKERSLRIYTMMHEELVSGLQKNITDEKTDMDGKLALLDNLTSTLQNLSKESRKLSFKKEELDSVKLKRSVDFLDKMLEQIKDSTGDKAKWDEKVKRHTSLGVDINRAEFIQESSGTLNSNKMLKEETTGSAYFDKWKEEILKTYKIDLDEKDSLSKARTLANSQNNNKYRYKIKNENDEMILQASSFARWWNGRLGEESSGEETINKFSILDPRWKHSSMGLKSKTSYPGSALTKTGSQWSAWLLIGPGHGLANTSFYYRNTSAGLAQLMKSRSEIKIDGKSVSIIDKGSKIEKLSSVAVFDNKKSEKEIEEIESLSSWLISQDDVPGQEGSKSGLYKAMNILLGVHMNAVASRSKMANELLKLDSKLTSRIEQKAEELKRLAGEPKNQNSKKHKDIVSQIRVLGSLKIMMFEEFMMIK